MEIKVNNILFKSNEINGVIGTYDWFINDFKKVDFDSNNIYINKKRLTKKEKRDLFKTISIVMDDIPNNYYGNTVYSFMKFYILENSLVIKDYRKKIKDSLKIVGLNNYENKIISTLSTLEVKLVLFATSLLSNPNIIILDKFFDCFDLKYRKKTMDLLNQLVDKYKKVVIICSNNSEFIYKYTKNLICFSNGNLLMQGNTNTLFEENTLKLMNNSINIPKTILFTNLVLEKKNIKLNYNKDIRDLIKDIYKKV